MQIPANKPKNFSALSLKLMLKVHSPVSVEESDVIAESASVELRVLEDPDHCVLLVVKLLRGIEATGVPLTNSHFQEAENIFILRVLYI